MMKLKLLKPVVVKGFPGIQVGQTFEVQSETFASELIVEGFAAEAPSPVKIQSRDPVIENRDPEMQPEQSSKRRPAK